MPKYALRAEGITVRYGNFVAVDNASLTVKPGEVVTIIGPNGAGKTSLLKALVGAEPLASGVVEVCGRVFKGGRVKAPDLISYVPAVPQVDPWSKVIDVLEVSRYGSGRDLVESRGSSKSDSDDHYIIEVAEEVGIKHLMGRYFGSLSSGEGKLVAIAAALVRRPKVVIMDEPLAFLDLRNQARVMGIMRKLASEGVAVVVASHELHLTPLYSDYVVVMSRGRVIAEGSPCSIMKSDFLRKVYGVDLVDTKELRINALVPKPEIPSCMVRYVKITEERIQG